MKPNDAIKVLERMIEGNAINRLGWVKAIAANRDSKSVLFKKVDEKAARQYLAEARREEKALRLAVTVIRKKIVSKM